MIVIVHNPGQLGNNLWAIANTIALAKECNSTIIIILKEEYYNYLDIENVKRKGAGKVVILNQWSITAKIINKVYNNKMLLGMIPNSKIDNFISENEFKKQYKRSRIYFINSWEHRYNKEFFIANSNYIRELLQPIPTFKKDAENKIKKLKPKTIAAVHIRRGDYKTFLDGKYYFSDAVYINYMRQLLDAVSSNMTFYIFSNEAVNLENFKGLNIVFHPNEAPITDMWAMSLCHYIIGPVSTFSMWASFWGNVPLYQIKDDASTISKDSLKAVKAQDVF